jgi:large subunit ribosomal protein L1
MDDWNRHQSTIDHPTIDHRLIVHQVTQVDPSGCQNRGRLDRLSRPPDLRRMALNRRQPSSWSAHLKTQSKRYRALKEKVKALDPIPLADAIKQLKSFGTTKFIQTVEVSTNLGIDPRQSDQNVRGSVALPHGIGKAVRVAVFAQGENAEKALAAGADIVGGDDLAQRIKGGFMDFDVALATPDMMGVVGPLGRLLGPRGLMPSPRSGTVTTDISAGVREFKAGKIEFRSDKGGNVAAAVGKLNFSDEQLADNINTFLNHLRTVKPAAAKGTYIRTITISATMSPGIRILA